MATTRLDACFEPYKDYGVLILRLLIGCRLIVGVWDNIVSRERMLEFEQFLAQFHFPLPLVSAYVSVYAQFICALLFIIGWQMRLAALVMVINFTVAILAVHIHDSVETAFPAWAILGSALFFLFYGAGKVALDAATMAKSEE